MNRFYFASLALLPCVAAAAEPAHPASGPAYKQAVEAVEAAQAHPGAGPIVRLAKVTSYSALPDGLELRCGEAAMRVTALTNEILRIRISTGGNFTPHHSWAVEPRTEHETVTVTPLPASGDAATVGFSTSALRVVISRDPLLMKIEDSQGKVLSADYPNYPVTFHGQSFAITKTSPLDEHYYGLGDKPGPLDRRNRAFTMWNTDHFGWQAATDPIYKSIPFFLALRNGVSYGIFLDDSWRSSFDFDKRLRDGLSFGAEGGPLDYYFLYGPSPKQVVERYSDLTGRMPLPPLWSLGYQQSRWSYTPESRVLEIGNKFRQLGIPIDAIYLDIGYQYKNRPFTVDPKTFPTFKKMIGELTAEHIHTIAITDLHIADAPNQGYAPYDSGMAGNEFLKNPDGSDYVGTVWPGPAVFPDFTRKATRIWWGNLYRKFYLDDGISGFWNDMNEPSIFDVPTKTMPLDVIHRIDGPDHPYRLATHREIHNIYGMENSRATYEGLLRLKPNERPFVLTRSSFAGGQRYATTWTGDNTSTWDQLRISTPQLLNLGISGFAMVGDNIGGFALSPEPDLLTRWIELGTFNPIEDNHTEMGSANQEPWEDGADQLPIRKHYIEVRYRLMPYIYTTAEESSRDGLPIMRPMFLEFPVGMEEEQSEFMFGPSLLVAPQAYHTRDNYQIKFPQKTDWYDFWTGKKVDLSKPVTIHPRLDLLPVYVRAGSILPEQPLVQSTSQVPDGPLEIKVYPGPNCHGSLYEDDGKSLDYQHGDFLRTSFTCSQTAGRLNLHIDSKGSYHPWWKQIEVTVFGAPHAARSVEVNGASARDVQFVSTSSAVRFVIPAAEAESQIRITY